MGVELIGRDAELQNAERFLAAALDGSRALVIEGEAGAGKTSVWEAALDATRRRGSRVLEARPAEAETSFAHAALGDLLAGHHDVLDRLPAPQRRALEVALLLSDDDGAAPDQQAVALAVLGALRVLAEQAPVVVAVDDIQWLDRPSAAVLSFAARRLDEERVGLLLAWRTDGDQSLPLSLERAFTADRLERMRLPALSLGAVSRLLHVHLDYVPSRPVLHRLHELSGGNPFFALELARALRAGTLHLEPGERLPVTLDALVGARLGAVSREAQRALATAAALAQPTEELVSEVASESGLAEGERAQIVAIRDGQIRFAHPLLASGAYALLDGAERRELHALVAERVADPEERARHLALAAAGPTEEVAGALEEAARRAQARGAPPAAAELYEAAARLTPPELVRERQLRTVDAAFCIFQCGDGRRARELLEDVVAELPAGPDRASALIRLALLRGYDDDMRAAEKLLRQAVTEAEGDERLLAAARMQLSSMLFRLRERLRESVEHAAIAEEAASRVGDLATVDEALAIRLLSEAALGDAAARRTLDAALDLQPRHENARASAQPLFQVSFARLWWDEVDGAAEGFEWLHRRAVEMGDEGSLPYVLVALAQVECVRGDAAAAARYADEGLEVTEQSGQATVGAYLLALRSLADAIAGEIEPGRERALRALALADRTSGRPAEHFARAALGLLELSAGRPDESCRALEPLVDFLRRERIIEHGTARVVPDQIEALVALGELDTAAELLAWYEGNARHLGRPGPIGTAERCGGLLAAAAGDVDGALVRLQHAWELVADVPIPLERGRTALVLGATHRRARHKRAAREALEQALSIFDQLGARVWAERATAELARISGRPAASGALTETESRIAALVAEGRSNKEIAAALYITPKTVGTQLSRIYRKVGVHSRTELARHLSDEAEAPKV
jgi:DNA-binding CsgD family transcriptional regulator